ncbi:hypothetical protein SLS58_010586 [Diplodia intermedia]|uniref:Uncharacterized protein n=1 Tax=Diplodia intermedia TaxID=856260 RepID=A0ABR3T4Y8_9PEZI
MMSSGAFYAAAGDRRNSVSNSNSTASDGQSYDVQPTAGGQSAAAAYAPSTASLEGNMAELLEAAAKATTESQRHAAAQQQQQQQHQQHQQQAAGAGGLRKVPRVTDLRGTAMQDEAAGQKRKRTATPPNEGGGEENHGMEGGEGQEGDRAGSQSPRKRARQMPTTASGFAEMQHHAPSANIHHYHQQQQSPGVAHQQHHQQQAGFGITDARAVGVHSAAALFRQPSTGSAAKKHTRPPMSKLFASLQLTPENFLRLQAAAKTYMLDEAHPERQSCVGSRGKGDTDMVKLRLFNCCRDFLNDGIGERFFGPDVPAPTENEVLEGETMPGRKWVWPRDGNKIVSLVTPLLRRMVTNERQRQYAQETRKGAGKRKSDAGASSAPPRDASSHDAAAAVAAAAATAASSASGGAATTPSPSTPSPYGPPPTQYPRFLQTQPPQSIYSTALPAAQPAAPSSSSSSSAAAADSIQQQQQQTQQHFLPQHHHHHHQPAPDQNVIQVLITKNNTKLLPRIDMPSWPSTPHHTLPLADLRRAVEEEVRGLLKRGLDLGIRRRRRRRSRGRMGTGTSTRMKAPVEKKKAAGDTAAAAAAAMTTTTTTTTTTAGVESEQDVEMAEAGGEELELELEQEHQEHQERQTGPPKEKSSTENEEGGGGGDATTINVGGGGGDSSAQKRRPSADAAVSEQEKQQREEEGGELATATAAEEAEAEDGAGEEGEEEEEEPNLDDITLEIRALTGRGLVLIAGDDEWRAVLSEVGRAVWMEGVLRVVVEVI